MTEDAMRFLAQLEAQARRATETRDRAHRLASTLRSAMTALRCGEDAEVVALRLRKRGVTFGGDEG